jgi:hypothetical protein
MPQIVNFRKHSSSQESTIRLVKKEPQKQNIAKQTPLDIEDIDTEDKNLANNQNEKQGISLVYKKDFVKPAETSAITIVKKDQTKPMQVLKLINLDNSSSIKENDVNIDESPDYLQNYFSNDNNEDLNILSGFSSNIYSADGSVSAEYIEPNPTLAPSDSAHKEIDNIDLTTNKHTETKPNTIAFAFASDYLSKKNNQESNQIQLVKKGNKNNQTAIEQDTKPETKQVNQLEENHEEQPKTDIPKKSSKISYEEVEYNNLPILIEVKNQNSSNINYITIPTTAVLFVPGSFKLSQNLKNGLAGSLITKVHNYLNNLPLSTSIVKTHGFELLGKTEAQILALDINQVKVARAPLIVSAANEFIQETANSYSSLTIRAMMSINPIMDAASILIEPNLNKAGTLLVDISYLLSGSNIYSTSLSIAQSASLFYQEEYEQAVQQTIVSATYILLPYAMQNNAIAVKITEFMISTYPIAPVIIALASTASIYKFYHILGNFTSDQGNINSMVAYKNLCHGLSEIVPKSLYDFTTKAIDLELSINKAKSNIEVENAEKYLIETKGIFGQKLHEHIYKKIIIEKYEILNKVLSGKITQEEADNLKTNHVIIKQENMAEYQCIEFKNLASKHNNDREYYCHNDKVIDNVLIGENNIIKDIITIYSVD